MINLMISSIFLSVTEYLTVDPNRSFWTIPFVRKRDRCCDTVDCGSSRHPQIVLTDLSVSEQLLDDPDPYGMADGLEDVGPLVVTFIFHAMHYVIRSL